jgi:outer membrane protein TolC
VQDEAVKAALEAVTSTTNQYKAGIVSYLDVVVSQAAALNNQRTAVDIQGRRITASVLLIKALGGGWKAADLPSNDDLLSDRDPLNRAGATPPAVADSVNGGSAEPRSAQ